MLLSMKESFDFWGGVLPLLAATLLLFSPEISQWFKVDSPLSRWWSAAAFGLYAFHHWMKSMYAMYIDLETEFDSLRPRLSFAGLLRERITDLERITVFQVNQFSLNNARERIEEIQKMVVQTLCLPESKWTGEPNGWAATSQTLAQWGALMWVLHRRYPHELPSPESLYDRTRFVPGTPPVREITVGNFSTVKDYSVRAISLLVREIELPDAIKMTEPEDLYITKYMEFMPPPVTGNEAIDRLVRRRWRLVYRPDTGASKEIGFDVNGAITVGGNAKESRWKLDENELVLVRDDGTDQNRFQWEEGTGRYVSTDHPQARALLSDRIAGQYIQPH
jgi:hypothetical protein